MKTFFLIFFLILTLTACSTTGKIESQKTAADKEIQQTAAAQEIEVKKIDVVAIKAEVAERPVVIAPPPTLETVHIVKPNETLGQIAKLPEVYNSAKMWPVIFEANRGTLHHPSKIYPGQKLRIPREAAEIDRMKKIAKTDLVVKEASVPPVKKEISKPLIPEKPTVAEPPAPKAIIVTEKVVVDEVKKPAVLRSESIRTDWTLPKAAEVGSAAKKEETVPAKTVSTK